MGEIVGAAIVAHFPGIMAPEEVRRTRGNGQDTDQVAGFDRLRAKVDAAKADTFVIFDTHWITTGLHLVTGAKRYQGDFTSSELPFVLSGVKYDFPGAPELAQAVEQVAEERKVPARAVSDGLLPLYYATLNVVAKLGRGEKVMSVGCCQNARPEHFLRMGEVIGEAARRAPGRVVLLASGALSHEFNDLDFKPRHPNNFHPDNVSKPENRKLDLEVIELFKAGRHDAVLDRTPELLKAHYEGHAAHYLQMVGALGGRDCRAKGTPLSNYEAAGGTGNIHMWFEV